MLLMCAGSICNTLFFKKNQREINDWCSYYFFLGGGGDYIFIVFVVFFIWRTEAFFIVLSSIRFNAKIYKTH